MDAASLPPPSLPEQGGGSRWSSVAGPLFRVTPSYLSPFTGVNVKAFCLVSAPGAARWRSPWKGGPAQSANTPQSVIYHLATR